MNMLRPISRKYDRAEHEYPTELDMLAAMIDGLAESGASEGAGAAGVRRDETAEEAGVKNGANLASVMSIAEMCWGDVGLLLSMPRQGLGNSAIASVADDEQQERFAGVWAGMAITEPGVGSDSANITTTATLDGDHYVLNGEKIYVTSGERADHIVVWATLDKTWDARRSSRSWSPRARPACGSTGSSTSSASGPPTPRRSSSRTAGSRPRTCSGSPGRRHACRASPARWPPSTTPAHWSLSMAIGCAKAALDLTRDLLEQAGVTVDYDRPGHTQHAAAAKFLQMEADWEGARLLMLQAAWMADNRQPNSLEASMAKAKAGRVGSDITLSCVELCGSVGYSEGELLEKWARDSKILDIFEGTQQIQQLIIARRVLGLSSAELK